MPISVTQAWEEAAVTADKAEIMLPTVEFHHPAFRDEHGNPTAIRAVRNTEDMVFRLDNLAPISAGADVVFTAIPFEIAYPSIGKLGAESTIRLDNVNREVGRYLDAASKMNSKITVIFRGYLVSDPTTVGQGPYTLQMTTVSRSGSLLEGRLRISSPGNLKFLTKVYDMVTYKSLLAVT